MADHASGPRAIADPVIDITDMFAFPSPDRPGRLVLILDVFPFAGTSALFSDAVDYRFRLRQVGPVPNQDGVPFTVGKKEFAFSCRFSAPLNRDEEGAAVQQGSCTGPNGDTVVFKLNDERGGEARGMRAFAGVRMDPFFFDGAKALKTILTGKLAFGAEGTSTMFRQNVLSIVIEIDAAQLLELDDGQLLAVVGETVTTGRLPMRLERFGRVDIKNILVFPNRFDAVNRNIELRDLYNQEDAFGVGQAYRAAYRNRMNSNLIFWDGLDQTIDWPPDGEGVHPLAELLLADFMVVDVSKPFAEGSYLEIERAILSGHAHQTCGGRSPNDDAVDTFLTMLVNAGKGPRVSDGVEQATVPASRTFPYLASPDPSPPVPKARAITPDRHQA